jgi:hypothetical protein
MINRIIPVFLLVLPISIIAQKPILERVYRLGDVYKYRLVCTESNNGIWQSTVSSICELRVVQDSLGVFYDEIQWLSKKTITAKDSVMQDDQAKAVKPYRISLAPAGKLDLPKIEVPTMTEPIEDFNTFFVAVSPKLGATALREVGDSIVKKEPVKADFSNGAFILKGDDCFSIILKMTALSGTQANTEADFLPSKEACFSYLLDEMKVPVVTNVANNFQMVQPTGNQQFNVQYGREIFNIMTATQRSDGKILNASMNNTLNLKLKINCDKDYKNCQTVLPILIQRDLTLYLLSD